MRHDGCGTVLQCVLQHLSNLRTWVAIICSGNGFAVAVMPHAWERKVV